jgi:hypothetical protein
VPHNNLERRREMLPARSGNPEARAAGQALIRVGREAGPRHKTFIYVNNRLEGSALGTLEAMAKESV